MFDSSYNTKTAKMSLAEREFNTYESDLYTIRKKSLDEINSDTALFKRYKNTSMNLIPLAAGSERKVYVLTGPEEDGVVIIGNDYLLTFDEKNELTSKKQLHKNLIPIYYGEKVKKGMQVEGSMHTHSPESGDFITATDICTLMLYEKFAKWKQHNVASKKYLNIWNCLTDELVVIPMSTIEKINNEDGKRNRNKKQNEK